MKASVFVGASVDGFIARVDGALDFLPPEGGEPHGYDEFMATVDALVIGRKTFDTALSFDTWPYGAKPVFVLSTRPLASPPPGAVVERMSGAPVDIVSVFIVPARAERPAPGTQVLPGDRYGATIRFFDAAGNSGGSCGSMPSPAPSIRFTAGGLVARSSRTASTNPAPRFGGASST